MYDNPRFNEDGSMIFTDDGHSIQSASDLRQEIIATKTVAAWVDTETYADKRARDYPPLPDQFDVMWKQFNQDRLGGQALIQEADDMLGAILAVKAKYPRPT